MFIAVLFFIELFFLFILSQQLTKHLSMVLYHKTKNKNVTIFIMAFLFFPGTLLHELAHYFMALLLLVRVGEMEFIPQLHGDQVKLGSVQIERTDPIRRIFIGMAPFFSGTCLVLGILYLAEKQQLFSNFLMIVLIGYLVFEIGNTMFSSRKDMEGAVEFLLILIFMTLVLFFFGLQVPAIDLPSFFADPTLNAVFTKGSLFLLFPIALDLLVISLLKLVR